VAILEADLIELGPQLLKVFIGHHDPEGSRVGKLRQPLVNPFELYLPTNPLCRLVYVSRRTVKPLDTLTLYVFNNPFPLGLKTET
jgi:hypothetical protein